MGKEPQAICRPWREASSSCGGTGSRIQSWERESGRCRGAGGSQVQVRARGPLLPQLSWGHWAPVAPDAEPIAGLGAGSPAELLVLVGTGFRDPCGKNEFMLYNESKQVLTDSDEIIWENW